MGPLSYMRSVVERNVVIRTYLYVENNIILLKTVIPYYSILTVKGRAKERE